MRPSAGQILLAWSPYLLLVACVLLWGYKPMQGPLNSVTVPIPWPGLHNLIARMPPVTARVSPYPAIFNLNWLSASGTSCMIATLLTALVLRIPPLQFLKILGQHVAAAGFFADYSRGGAGPGVSDELLRRHGDSGTGIRRHRRIVSVL